LQALINQTYSDMLIPEINILPIVVAALVPNIIGAIYYGPLFGKSWLGSLGMTTEDMKGRNEALIYGSALGLSLIISFFINWVLQMGHKNVSEAGELIFASHNTFPHGALHGTMLCMAFVMPVIVCLGLFQKSSAKNVLLNVGFWFICYALMGGILDVWQ